MTEHETRVKIHALAHGRSGDKGDTANISVIAYREEFFPVLVEQLTVDRVAEIFSFRKPARVQRFVLTKLHALNFVIDGALDGGVNESLGLDTHGKCLSFLMLDAEIEVPTELRSLLITDRQA